MIRGNDMGGCVTMGDVGGRNRNKYVAVDDRGEKSMEILV